MKRARLTKSTPLSEALKIGKECSNSLEKCRLCCAYNSGIVLPEEVDRIADRLCISREKFIEKYLSERIIFNAKAYRINTADRQGKPYSSCVFFRKHSGEQPKLQECAIYAQDAIHAQECAIHDVKPLHCRLANCNEHGEALHQWFVLNFLLDANDPDSIRAWDSYARSTKIIPGGNIEELVPDKEKRNKILSHELQGKSRQELKELSDQLKAFSESIEKKIEDRFKGFQKGVENDKRIKRSQ